MINRETLIGQIENCDQVWDIVIIGGGATGLGAAVDAANRGYKTLLIEQADFAKGTSSRSTKLVHGGVRYLAQGDIQMVVAALRERGYMKLNAPHLVKDMRFIIGNYRWWERPFYGIGLTLYDLLAGGLSLGRSLPLSKKQTLKKIPGLLRDHLHGGVLYHDGQFDDSRMAITLALTAIDSGATVLNYMRADDLTKDENGKINGVQVSDCFTNKQYQIKTKVVVNATGVFIDDIIRLDSSDSTKKVRPSQGVHLVVDARFLGGTSALMIPKTKDGRVLFGVPWHGKVVLGTTDTPLNEASLEPRALDEEIDFILDQAGQYLTQKPTRKDILSVFAGLRPLAAPTHNDTKKTKEISRNHKIYLSDSGLLTITGGKWTTYREMGEEAIDRAAVIGQLIPRPSTTRRLKLHGYLESSDRLSWDYVYGNDIQHIRQIITENPAADRLLHPDYSFKAVHVIWAVRNELAETVEDVLARRVRALFLDAKIAMQIAPDVAKIMAIEMNKTTEWEAEQVKQFIALAKEYTV